MHGEETDEPNIKTISSKTGGLSHVKRSLKQKASPISPLSPESLSCSSIDFSIDDDVVDESIEKLYKNIDNITSSDKSMSIGSFTTYGNDWRTDSELYQLVGDDVVAEEDLKEVIVVEHKNVSHGKMSKRKKSGKIVNGMPSRVQGKTSNLKSISQKPPVVKKNMVQGSRRPKSNCFQHEHKSSQYEHESGQEDGKKATDNPYLGPYLLKKARDMISSGDNPKRAFELVLRAKKSFESCVCNKPNLDYVMCLHLLASMYCSAGQHREAIPLLERSIEIPNKELDQNHALAKFVGCMQLGDIYAMFGQIEKSILLYKVGLEVQKHVLGEQDPHFADSCRYVAEAYVQAFEFDEAEKLCQMALDIRKVNGVSPSIEEAADRRLMGLICDAKGSYEEALEHYVFASMAMHNTGHELDVAVVDCNIGDSYLFLARYDKAISSYNKAIVAFTSSKGGNHPTVASVFVRLAELYNTIGMFGDSKSYCEKALYIYDNPPPGADMEDVANGLSDLAAIFESMNELDESLNLLHKGLKIFKDDPGRNSTIAGIEARMGVMYYMQGNYYDSYNYLKNSVLKFGALGDKKSSLYGITLNQLGLTCVQLYAISEAADLFKQAKSILEEEYGLYHPDTLGVYSNLAGTYDALGRWEDAIDLLEYVVLMREEKLGTADPTVDDEKYRLAKLLKQAGMAKRRRSRSLENLLDKNFHTVIGTVKG